MIAISAARIYGPKQAATPEGHPILLITPSFNTASMSPVKAMAYAAEKRFGIMVPSIGGELTLGTIWELQGQYKVEIPEHRTSLRPKHEALYLFDYLPERPLIAQKLAAGMKPLPDKRLFNASWYLKRVA